MTLLDAGDAMVELVSIATSLIDAQRAGAGGAGSAQSSAPAGTVINVGVQNIHVAGNLDPTSSTAWRATIERLRQELRSVEMSYR